MDASTAYTSEAPLPRRRPSCRRGTDGQTECVGAGVHVSTQLEETGTSWARRDGPKRARNASLAISGCDVRAVSSRLAEAASAARPTNGSRSCFVVHLRSFFRRLLILSISISLCMCVCVCVCVSDACIVCVSLLTFNVRQSFIELSGWRDWSSDEAPNQTEAPSLRQTSPFPCRADAQASSWEEVAMSSADILAFHMSGGPPYGLRLQGGFNDSAFVVAKVRVPNSPSC